jgi:hypothetical protein
VRESHHLYGLRRANERPDELPLDIRRKDWTIETIKLPVPDYPFVFRMPRFPAPRFLCAAHADDADYHRKFDYRQIDTLEGVLKAQSILALDP